MDGVKNQANPLLIVTEENYYNLVENIIFDAQPPVQQSCNWTPMVRRTANGDRGN